MLPSLECSPNAQRRVGRLVDDRSVRESEDLPSGDCEVAVLATIPFELIPVETVRRPPIALNDHRCVDESKVDLPSSDPFVERDWRKMMPSDEVGEDELEDGVCGPVVDRPGIDC